MSALERLIEEASKREVKLGKQIQKKDGKEQEIEKVREEDFKIT
jgi:hypothetical protein